VYHIKYHEALQTCVMTDQDYYSARPVVFFALSNIRWMLNVETQFVY